MESAPLWEYYAHSDDLSVDEQAALFLTHASIKHKVFGLYWLQYVNQDKIRGILDSIPSKHHQNVRAATAYAALGDHTGLSNFCEERDITSDSISSLKRISEKDEEGRYRNLIEEEKHEISCEDIDIQINLSDLNPTEIREEIPMISKNLYTVEGRIDVYNKWFNIRNKIRELLGNLEIKLAIYAI